MIKYVLIGLIVILGVTQQVYAYTVFEFQIANPPDVFHNTTFAIKNLDTEYEYKWFAIDHGPMYYRLDGGARDASDDPQMDDLEPASCCGYATYALFVIDQTLEPGTPLQMCVTYDNLTRCESEAVSSDKYSEAILEVEFTDGATSNRH